MYPRVLYLLFSFLAGSFMTFAAERGVSMQDSVKRVYIKVVAAEKPKAISIDSIKKPIALIPPKTRRKLSSSNRSDILLKSSSGNQTISQVENPGASHLIPVSKDEADEPSTTIIIKKAAKPLSKLKASPGSSKLPPVTQDKVHSDEDIAAVQSVDNATIDSNHLKTSKTYLWVGIVLVVVGIILGILFGKTALLVSVAGMVFVIIGYAIKS